MAFANPTALWLLLLLPIPWLLAGRRMATRRQAVSNLYLWQSPIREEPVRPTLRQTRRSWLAALQTAFMAAVIVAIAGPFAETRPSAQLVDVRHRLLQAHQ